MKVWLLLVPLCIYFVEAALAVEISETGKNATSINECSMVIEGEIKKDDPVKIEAALAKIEAKLVAISYETDYVGLDYVVCISGSGGDYLAAIKIAEIFTRRMVTTSVPEGAACLAACAIAFMGGRDCCVELGLTMSKRYLSPKSTLGFGAPTLATDKKFFSTSELSKTFIQSLNIISELQTNSANLDVSENIINKLIAHRNGKYFLIKPDPAHQHNYVDRDGKVYHDIWIPGVSGRVNQGTLDQRKSE